MNSQSVVTRLSVPAVAHIKRRILLGLHFAYAAVLFRWRWMPTNCAVTSCHHFSVL